MKYFTILIIGLITLVSCTKEPEEIPVSTALKQFFNYSPDSYWVYRDSVTGESDSISVYENGVMEVVDQSGTKRTERITIFFNLFIDNVKVGDPFYFVLTGNEISLQYYSGLKGSSRTGYGLTGTPFIAPRIDSDLLYADYVQIFDSLTIDGRQFFNVVEAHQYINNSNRKLDDWVYLTAKEGIVKMKLNNIDSSTSHTYFLKKWDIKIK